MMGGFYLTQFLSFLFPGKEIINSRIVNPYLKWLGFYFSSYRSEEGEEKGKEREKQNDSLR